MTILSSRQTRDVFERVVWTLDTTSQPVMSLSTGQRKPRMSYKLAVTADSITDLAAALRILADDVEAA